MPLTFTKAPPKKIFQGLGNKILKGLNLLRPEFLLAGFVVVAIILAFLKSPTGFYVITIVFILCYFAERIAKILQRKKYGSPEQEQKQK